uniref:Sugar phosphate transporter domain-containing protein n=2 Tax=Compsopogon caeruleus TaxID=31354 RepID=A0A7S1T751_9RHOD|eukprot:CAMPEP_0184685794 /NCGR_PEP_ID=MMETSP0312-20130426/20237_1 /TAXON_ID=31354 /ORGANISM="Compsopogon coeruleus, Strain SAG 36.94" /LENGTH=377 /DNA_ID=CAMNT_0027140255 /DNA_START=118 /DNA_END=1251 /DNA_ORIENTATION=-
MAALGFVIGGVLLVNEGRSKSRRVSILSEKGTKGVGFRSVRGRVVGIQCSAAGSGQSSAGQGSQRIVTPLGRTLKVGFYFGLWYFFNVVFNVLNKSTLNVWSYPWTLSLVQLGGGSLYCALLWILGLRQKPNVSWGLLRAMILPVLGHLGGHVLTCVSFSMVAISFSHVVKSAEPAFGAAAAALALREFYPWTVYASLIPIISGVALAAVTELTFTWAGFITALLSNVAFAARNVFSKITMKNYKDDPTLGSRNMYGLISIVAFLLELPMALIADRGIPKLIPATSSAVSPNTLLLYILSSAIMYHLYNESSYMALGQVSPVTFSVGNTVKRVIIIVASILVFKTKFLPLNAFGMIIALLGTFLYSWTKERASRKPA